jgi:O-antigen/teichoic acid export membrane protein
LHELVTESVASASGTSLAANTIWNVIGHAAPLLVAIVAIPPTIRGIGTDRFGALTLVWVLIGYFSLFDLGLGRALTKLVAEKIAAGQGPEVPGIVRTALVLALALGCAATIFLLVPRRFIVDVLLGTAPELRTEMRHSLIILAVSLPFVISTTALRGVLEARQRFGLVNLLRVPLGVLTFVAPLLVLQFSRSLTAIVAVLAAIRVIAWAAHLALCWRVMPALRSLGRIDRAAAMPLLRLGGWMTVSNVVGPLMVYLDRFLVGALLTLSAVAYYATPYEVVTKLLLIAAAASQVFFPAFAASLVRDRSGAASLFARVTKILFLTLYPITLLLATFAYEGLRLWLGASFADHSTHVLQWLAAGVFVNGLAQIPFALLQSAGRADVTAKLHLVELPLYLVLVWWLIRYSGIDGAAAAWTIRATVDAALLFLLAARVVLPERMWGWQLIPATAVALAGFAAAGMIDGTTTRALFFALAMIGFSVAAWLGFLDASDRALVRAYVAERTR